MSDAKTTLSENNAKAIAEGQNAAYVVLTEEERAKGFVRPYRDSYRHKPCGVTTSMHRDIAETYARDPNFYNATWCVHCRKHLPLNEFVWADTNIVVGS